MLIYFKILKYENFKLLESEEFKVLDLKQCLYKGIEKATINHEKILADFFDLSLSQIDPISSDKHTFWTGKYNYLLWISIIRKT